jgi:hypothetical protein
LKERHPLRDQPVEFTIRTQKEAYNLEAHVMLIGEDILVAIWGGERPHIGAVAVAQPRPSLRDKRQRSATASVFCYVGHKDDVIAKEAAEKISSTLDTNVTVAAGIHWDDIDEAGITYVMEHSRELVEMIIERIDKEEPG